MGTPLLSITSAGSPPGSVLRCSGEIDASNVDELRSELSRSIRNGLATVEVDLLDITFLDSSAILALLAAQSTLVSRNGTVRVLGTPRTARLLRIMGLDRVLQCVEVPVHSCGPPRPGVRESRPLLAGQERVK